MPLNRVLPLLVALLAVAGCQSATGPRQLVSVSLTVDQTTLKPGDSVLVTVNITNESPGPVTISGSFCPPPFVVRNAAGAVVGPAASICPTVLTVRTLAPRQTIVLHTAWRGDASVPGITGTAFVAPGTYALQGRVGAADGLVESAPVSVVVQGASSTS